MVFLTGAPDMTAWEIVIVLRAFSESQANHHRVSCIGASLA